MISLFLPGDLIKRNQSQGGLYIIIQIPADDRVSYVLLSARLRGGFIRIHQDDIGEFFWKLSP